MSRILLITQSLPWPLRRNGGAQRTALVQRALAKHGQVDVIGIGGAETFESDAEKQLMGQCGVVEHFDTTPKTRHKPKAPWPISSVLFLTEDWNRRYRPQPPVLDWIERRQREHGKYDLVVGRYLQAAAQGGMMELALSRGVPTILDFDDIDYLTFRFRLKQKPWPGLNGKLGSTLVARKLKKISEQAVRTFGAVWMCSDEDAALMGGQGNVRVLPNIPYTSPDVPAIEPLPPNEQSREVLFVGDLRFPPNADGLTKFLAEVWPLVLKQVPDATITIIGRGLSDAMRAKWSASPNTNVVGYADDLRAAYAKAAFTVAPIWFGGGTKIKVIESYAYGRPCVTTGHSLRGYAPLVQAGALTGHNDPAPMAAECVKLLKDVNHRRSVSDVGAKLAAEQYSFDAVQRVVDVTLASLLPATRSTGFQPVP
jgi:glycosyltransferase involved in cell wall biosynthesis